MTVKFNCPACDQPIETTEEQAREGVRCPNCNTGFVPEKFKTVNLPPPTPPPKPAQSPKSERKRRPKFLVASMLIVSAILVYQQREEINATQMVADKLQVPTTKWEYEVVMVENYNHTDEQRAFATNGLKEVEFLNGDPGDFYFDSSLMGVDLSKYASDGWELVAAVPQLETVRYVSDSPFNVRTGKIYLIFKRAKE